MYAFCHHIVFNHPPTAHPENTLTVNSLSTLPILPYDYTITYEQNQNRKVVLTTDNTFAKNERTQRWAFIIEDVVSFVWLGHNKEISYFSHQHGNDELIHYWLLHTLLPIYFSIENIYEMMHAGGVEVDGNAVAFIAPSFGGKSTLTDYFIQKEHPMISDDRIGLRNKDDTIYAVPSYPFHRPYRKMEDLGLPVEHFVKNETPLHAIYALERVDPCDDIHITPLTGLDSFKVLQLSFDFNLPLNKARAFKLIAEIAKKVPIYKVSIPWDLNQLENVYNTICSHSNTIKKEKSC